MHITEALEQLAGLFKSPEHRANFNDTQLEDMDSRLVDMRHMHEWLAERNLLDKVKGHDFAHMDTVYREYKNIYQDAGIQLTREQQQNKSETDFNQALEFLQKQRGITTQPPKVVTPHQDETDSIPISEIFEEFKQEKISSHAWSPKTVPEIDKYC